MELGKRRDDCNVPEVSQVADVPPSIQLSAPHVEELQTRVEKMEALLVCVPPHHLQPSVDAVLTQVLEVKGREDNIRQVSDDLVHSLVTRVGHFANGGWDGDSHDCHSQLLGFETKGEEQQNFNESIRSLTGDWRALPEAGWQIMLF